MNSHDQALYELMSERYDGLQVTCGTLRASLGRVERRNEELNLALEVAQREREAIAVEMAGLRRDAERYRWLRKGDLDSLRVIGLPQTENVYDRELDAEIQAGK